MVKYKMCEVLEASKRFFGGNEQAAKAWMMDYAIRSDDGDYLELSPEDTIRRAKAAIELSGNEASVGSLETMPLLPVTETRPKILECDVVRFQNNKEKWVAFVGLLNGYPYEIFTGLQDDEVGIALPKTVTKGKIIRQVNEDGTRRYDFQFENKRGYKTTVEGLSEKFNPEYWNYAKLISGVLRYRMPLTNVIKLVGSLSLKDESINTWKTGVERALKKYLGDEGEQEDVDGTA